MEITGKITKMLEPQTGTSKAGKEWSKQSFVVETDEQYNNLYCFDVFGGEKVANLTKYNKVGDTVKVEFNVNTNEWEGKYFTSLSAWRIGKVESKAVEPAAPPVSDTGLPF